MRATLGWREGISLGCRYVWGGVCGSNTSNWKQIVRLELSGSREIRRSPSL